MSEQAKQSEIPLPRLRDRNDKRINWPMGLIFMKNSYFDKLWTGVFSALWVASMAWGAAPETAKNPVAVPFQLRTPTRGVKLTGGVLKRTFDNNLEYLLNDFSVDDLLYVFRERAGKQNPPGKPFAWDKLDRTATMSRETEKLTEVH